MKNWTEDKEVLAQLPKDLPLVVESVVYQEGEDSDGEPVYNVVVVTPPETDIEKVKWDKLNGMFLFLNEYFIQKPKGLIPLIRIVTRNEFSVSSFA